MIYRFKCLTTACRISGVMYDLCITKINHSHGKPSIMNNTTETQVMTYEEAKSYYEPIAVYVANIVSEVTPPEIEVRAEWNGADDILVDFYKFPGSLTAMVPVEVAEGNDDDAMLEIVAKQLREFDGREYLKEMKETIEDEYELDDFETTGRVWSATRQFHESGSWM